MTIIEKIRDIKAKLLNEPMADDKRHTLMVQLIELQRMAATTNLDD